MLRNKIYTISDFYSTKMCVFIMLEMTPSYLLEYRVLKWPGVRIMVSSHGSPDTVTTECFFKISPKQLAQNVSVIEC